MARRTLVLLSLLTFFATSCRTQAAPAPVQLERDTAVATRQRPVRPPAGVPAVQQWTHEWARGAVFYEIFVRSFSDSNGDGVGDLPGLIAKLDYLNDGDPATTQDLGVDALWLMPVFDSPSYHGYDTIDYETINPDYGTNEDFTRLCEEAHRRGMRIIVDFVINHSGSGHPWFEESASSPSSPKRDWYVWKAANPGWTQPWGGNYQTWHPSNGAYYYGVFWGGMPDVNYETPAVREEMKRLARLWLARGVDGYRLDATRYLVETGGGMGQADTAETHAYLKEFAEAVRTAKPDAFLVGENWTDTIIIGDYFGSTDVIKGGDELPSNFNFPLAGDILRAISSGDATGIAARYAEMKSVYPAGIIDSPFLTNHDQVRLATQLGNDAGRLRNAAAVLLTLPGAPFLYYGEEVGIQNGPTNGDESKRTPMPWTASGGFTTGNPWFQYAPGVSTTNVATQSGDAGSLLARYRALIRARRSSPALTRGDIGMLTPQTGSSPVLAFLRLTSGERVLVVHNLTDGFQVGRFSFEASSFETIFADSGVGGPSGIGTQWTVNLPPRTTGVWRVR
ncbi:MAG: alpha-amylase family glycosyl hydrolase [Thermoanaerobaculia bacterium]